MLSQNSVFGTLLVLALGATSVSAYPQVSARAPQVSARAPQVSARAPQVSGRATRSRRLAQLLSRASTDTCGNVDAPLEYNGDDLGTIDACLCSSAVPTFITTNSVAQQYVALAGQDAAISAVNDLITSAADSQTCNYPDNSVASCSSDNACAFTCINGFTQSGDSCVCTSPNNVCNGVCTSGACPTASATRRDYHISLRKRAVCPAYKTACGVYERRGALSDPWECVDTRNDLESCGGCITPLDMFSPRGVDCSAIPGVVDVSCRSGSCVVRRCAAGFSVTPDRSSCMASLVGQN